MKYQGYMGHSIEKTYAVAMGNPPPQKHRGKGPAPGFLDPSALWNDIPAMD